MEKQQKTPKQIADEVVYWNNLSSEDILDLIEELEEIHRKVS